MHVSLLQLCLSIWSSLLLPQAGQGETGPDLSELAREVNKAHRGDGDVEDIRDFAAGLRIEQLAAAEGEDRGEFELHVRFLSWQREGPPGQQGREIPLIRYELVDSAARVVRGRDRDGRFWAVINDETKDLGGREFEEDRKSIVRDTKLARQMLRFLDPAGVLLGLKAPGPVKDEMLRIGRPDRPIEIPSWTVTGTDDTFPVLNRGGENLPVRLKVFVEKETGKLLAVEAVPMDAAGKPQEEQAEFVMLRNHVRHDGVLMPMQIVHWLGPGGRRKPQMKVTLTRIELAPGLEPKDFDRP